MPAPTFAALDFIKRAMRALLVLDPTDEPEDVEAQDALAILNDMIEDWRNQHATTFILEPKQYPLTVNVGSYTIGDGGTFSQDRPVWIERWSVVPVRTASPVLEIPHRRVLTLPEWQRIAQKGATAAYPYALYYDRGFSAAGFGKVYVYPVPTSATADVILYTPGVLTRFADLATAYAFPQGYPRAIRLNLAIELAPEFGVEPPQTLLRLGAQALASIKRANHQPREADIDARFLEHGSRTGTYDIYTDS